MIKFKPAIAGILALIAGFYPAIAQQFPTVPDRTVIGRIGVGGQSGPSQAIPFTTLAQNILTGLSRTVIANDPIVNTDCGKTVALGGNVLFAETLPAVTGFQDGCEVTVVNTDIYTGSAGRGKQLTGFPTDLSTILWPQQTAKVKIINGAWKTTSNPGRWKNPTTVTWHVDKTNGNNANDGLAATTGAVQDAQTANTNAVYRSDTQGTTPIIAMACSQTHTTALNMGGIPLGNNLVQLSPDGNCGFTWTNAGPCIAIGDLAELNLNLTAFGGSGSATFGCNTSNSLATGNILLHNTSVLDVTGTPIWNPAGTNDNFLFCDGPCEFTIANGVTQATGAGGNYIINMSAGGKGTQSGTISASAAGGATGIYYLYGPAILSLGTPSGGGWSSLGPSKVNGGAVLVNNGITPAGGVTVGPTGHNCTSLTSSVCSTVIGANEVTRANEAQGVARSVIGVAGNATANVADIQGAAGQVLAVNPAGTALGFVGPGQTPGTATNDNAAAGTVGEYISTGSSSITATITVTIASPAVVTWTAHGFVNSPIDGNVCTPINFTTTGALPTGIVAGSTFYVIGSSIAVNTFQIASSVANCIAGTAVNTSGTQSGVQTGINNASIVTGVAKDITGISLTAGDWDVCGLVSSTVAGGTVISLFYGYLQTVSTTQSPIPNNGAVNVFQTTFSAGGNVSQPIGCKRYSLASTTTIFLGTLMNFSSTNAAYGFIRARRIR